MIMRALRILIVVTIAAGSLALTPDQEAELTTKVAAYTAGGTNDTFAILRALTTHKEVGSVTKTNVYEKDLVRCMAESNYVSVLADYGLTPTNTLIDISAAMEAAVISGTASISNAAPYDVDRLQAMSSYLKGAGIELSAADLCSSQTNIFVRILFAPEVSFPITAIDIDGVK